MKSRVRNKNNIADVFKLERNVLNKFKANTYLFVEWMQFCRQRHKTI